MKRYIRCADQDQQLRDFIVWYEVYYDGERDEDYYIVRDCIDAEDAVKKFRRSTGNNAVITKVEIDN